ncbi:MAG: diguanylate cyclase [bacterium]
MGADNKRYLIIEAILFFMVIALFLIFILLNNKDFYILSIAFSVFLIFLFFIRTFFFIKLYKNNLSVVKREEMYNLIRETIAGGYLSILLDNNLTIINLDNNFLKLTGYNKKEIEDIFNNSLLQMIEENYRENFLHVLNNQTRQQSKSQAYYTIKCKGQKSKGVINMFRLYINSKGIRTANILLLEPSSFKQVQQQRDLDNMRYKIVAEQSESIIFDYNPNDESIFLNSHFERKFGYTIKGNLFDYIKKHNIIYKDDLPKFMNLSVCEKDYNETEIRLKKADGKYIWCKLRITTIMGQDNKPSRLVGKIIDVDRSRREKFNLIEKTKRDLMTGMYNKLTTKALINESIESNEKSLSAFLLIDIDNFKNINDKLGHMQGDNVLTEISEGIKSIFRSSDIIGRIGGDEFVVFIKDLYDENHAEKKAMEILQTIRNIQNKKLEGLVVTVSIGIAFYNKEGSDYDKLYINADKALYQAKNKGKNTYELYHNIA